MSSTFAKLNLKDQSETLVLNAPTSFEPEIKSLVGVTVRRAVQDVKLATGDAVVWFAYPKGTSKNYTCEFNRDNGWTTLGETGFEGVRMVAIDEDWSAVRFRRVEFIESITRDKERALTAQGRARSGKRR